MGLKTRRKDEGERWTFRDPAEVCARRQEADRRAATRTCAGCKHLIGSPLGGPEVACDVRVRRPAKSVADSRRCALYHLQKDPPVTETGSQ